MEEKYKSAYRRMFKVDELIREGRCPSAAQIAEKLGVSKRTILRDLAYMETELSAPIVYDEEKNGYFYTNPRFALSDIVFTDDDLSVLLLSKRLLESLFSGTFYKTKVQETFQAILDHAGNSPQITGRTVRENIQVALSGSGDFSLAEKLLEAMDGRLCALGTKSDGTGILLRPIRLIYAWEAWHLLYITEGYHDNRDFKLEPLALFKKIIPQGKGAGEKIPDVIPNVEEWASPDCGRSSYVEKDKKNGDTLHILFPGRSDGFHLTYRRNADGTLSFIENFQSMMGGHVMEFLLDSLDGKAHPEIPAQDIGDDEKPDDENSPMLM